jgi:hypothetical protein
MKQERRVLETSKSVSELRPIPALNVLNSHHSIVTWLSPDKTMTHHRGDDLEDDFMPDETVAFSEDEGFGSPIAVGDQDDIGKLFSADEGDEGNDAYMERTKPLSEKKRRQKEKEKERKAKECLPNAPCVRGP